MKSPKRVSLLLAVTLFISVMVFLVATLNIGEASVKTLRSKVLRRHDRTKSKPDAGEMEYLRKHAQEENREERVFDDQIPKHLPIKVKIRVEKEKAAKELGNERWHRDLEIEVKNTGDKPIYYLSLILEMPEIKVNGDTLTFILRYGKRSVFDESKGQARPEDVPLKPKGTSVLSLDNGQAHGWEIWMAREKRSHPRKVLIEFEELNFGDGTGFVGGGAPWPLPKSKPPTGQAWMPSLVNRTDVRSHHAGMVNKTTTSFSILVGGESASLWPTSFQFVEWLNSQPKLLEADESEPQPEHCCPNNCRFVITYEASHCYYCPTLHHADPVNCLEEEGNCWTVVQESMVCSDGNSCPYQKTYPCGYVPPSPTPTPTPTPTPDVTPSPSPIPTCDPATKPNNTNCTCDTTPFLGVGAPPRWDCRCSVGEGADRQNLGNAGCPSNKYNNGSDCCVCIVQECPGGGTPNKYSCACPTPTPLLGAGGGGDPVYPENSGGGGSPPNCTNYYWVWYISYDGGQTWQPTGETQFAGCW